MVRINLLDAAVARRTREQLEALPRDPHRDPWAIRGPLRCPRCREALPQGYQETLCRKCRPRVVCKVGGCVRSATADGRCAQHQLQPQW